MEAQTVAGAVDDQEDKWAQAVYWNELIDQIEELPDAGTFIQTYSMAVVARGKSRIPQCYRCGDRGHMRDKCTYTEDVCYRCKLAGHKSESCTEPLALTDPPFCGTRGSNADMSRREGNYEVSSGCGRVRMPYYAAENLGSGECGIDRFVVEQNNS